MRKILIFGNSGSGKSTFAKKLCVENKLTHLDLDLIAWKDSNPPERKLLTESKKDLIEFIHSNDAWVIEGCYTDLLELISSHSNEIIFLNLSVEECISNARSRPWEPHKYKPKQAQDANLDMLINWITQYIDRDDTFSKSYHQRFYNDYSGCKQMLTSNK